MIRINVSGAARPKGKRAAAAAVEYGGGEGPSPVVFLLIGVVLLGILAGDLVYFVFAVFGLAAIATWFGPVFVVVRWAGTEALAVAVEKPVKQKR